MLFVNEVNVLSSLCVEIEKKKKKKLKHKYIEIITIFMVTAYLL